MYNGMLLPPCPLPYYSPSPTYGYLSASPPYFPSALLDWLVRLLLMFCHQSSCNLSDSYLTVCLPFPFRASLPFPLFLYIAGFPIQSNPPSASTDIVATIFLPGNCCVKSEELPTLMHHLSVSRMRCFSHLNFLLLKNFREENTGTEQNRTKQNTGKTLWKHIGQTSWTDSIVKEMSWQQSPKS